MVLQYLDALLTSSPLKPLEEFLLEYEISIQFALVALIIAPTFVMCVIQIASNKIAIDAAWQRNLDRRKQRKAAGQSQRLNFDEKGRLVVEEKRVLASDQVGTLSQIVRDLLTAVEQGHANVLLYANHANLKQTLEVAWRCFDAVANFVAHGSTDPKWTSTFDGMADLAGDLAAKVSRPSGGADAVPATLNGFKEELAVLHAVFGNGVPSGDLEAGVLQGLTGEGSEAAPIPRKSLFLTSSIHDLKQRAAKLQRSCPPARSRKYRNASILEPTETVRGVHARTSRSLSFFAEKRDKYGLGSVRVLLAVSALFLAVGPVRFLGLTPFVGMSVFLALHFFLELRRIRERGLCRQWTGLFRLMVPVIAGGLMAIPLYLGFLTPASSNAELEAKFTFLPVPTHYVLEEVPDQPIYVSAVYGFMHANLVILLLIPLPICYRIQAIFARCCPCLRFVVPSDPVWMHRTLGYILLGGLVGTSMIWLVFQGFIDCAARGIAVTCLAFDPREAVFVDVFVLRFHIVWPFFFFLLPLMIFSRYPGTFAKAAPPHATRSQERASSSRGRRGASEEQEPMLRLEGAHVPAVEAGRKAGLCRRALGCLSGLVFDVCLITVPLAGSALVLMQDTSIADRVKNSFFPFWFPVLAGVVLHLFFKLIGRLEHGSVWSDLFIKSWWEAAYACHVLAFSVVLAAALVIRYEVFYPAVPFWGLYFLDRLLIFCGACKNKTYIHIAPPQGENPGEGQIPSSYVVDRDAKPAHVRLIVRKPPGFRYKAGQWVQLALPSSGNYCCLPGPFALQWHPFSIASAEHEGYLEFHIAVQAGDGLLDGAKEVHAAPHGHHFVLLRRVGHCLDRFCPHRVPRVHRGRQTAPAEFARSSYAIEPRGVYMEMRKGRDAVQVLPPQAQWTGKLWNTVQWLEGRPQGAPEEAVRIMGPYGIMPYTVDAHRAVMLIGAGVGFPSTGSMLRKLLHDNLDPGREPKAVCFIWTATNMDQLCLCFPSLVTYLAEYVHERGIKSLQKWLTVKIFISNFKAGEYLEVFPADLLFPKQKEKHKALKEVRAWLLGREVVGNGTQTVDADGTYIAQGSLGANFCDILQRSAFIREQVIEARRSLGICFCGPADLAKWIRSELSNTVFPYRVEFAQEATSS